MKIVVFAFFSVYRNGGFLYTSQPMPSLSDMLTSLSPFQAQDQKILFSCAA
jgi:hypothetical protein